MTDSSWDARFATSRRRLLRAAIAGAGAGLLAGCDRLSNSGRFVDVLGAAEPLSMRVQRALSGDRLAAEYPESMISPLFRPNGSTSPQTPEYLALKADGFRGYRLQVAGLVERPLELSLDALRALPTRTQVTRHDCVEGWSVIGKWKGVRLEEIINRVQPATDARYVVFRCMDTDSDGVNYFESIDMIDAVHPQTILAYELNDRPLPIDNGAPLRLRVENQLGYKHAKYIRALEFVSSLDKIGQGKGGYWEDQGYEWYAGI